jgi:hypothetical protein
MLVAGAQCLLRFHSSEVDGEVCFRTALEGALDGLRCAQGAIYLAEVRGHVLSDPRPLALFLETAGRNPALDEWIKGPVAELVPALAFRKSVRRNLSAATDRYDWCRLASSLAAAARYLEARLLGEGLDRRLVGVSPAVTDLRQ